MPSAAGAQRPRGVRWVVAAASLVVLLDSTALRAQPAASSAPVASASAASAAQAAPAPIDDARDNALVVNHRTIVTFRAHLMGRSPRERAIGSATAVKLVLQRGGPGQVAVWQGNGMAGLQVDGVMVFYLLPDDIDTSTTLSEAADAVRARLQLAVDEVRETRDLRRLGLGVVLSAAATVIAYVLMRVLFGLRRRLLNRLEIIFNKWQPKGSRSLLATYTQHAHSAAHGVALVVTWGAVLVLLDFWATFVLRQFAFTRYWGERATEWMLGVLEQFALAITEAVPGLLMAILIFLLARLAARANSAMMQRIERGELELAAIDRDIAGPTRRIGNFVIWLFALAMAYPFLPGSNSDAFKGVSVLAGLMLSLGASNVVGQIMCGPVADVFALAAGGRVREGRRHRGHGHPWWACSRLKIHTGLGEEVSVPNSVVVGGPVRNYSRLAQGQVHPAHGGDYRLFHAVAAGAHDAA